jgi:hypothetical protein
MKAHKALDRSVYCTFKFVVYKEGVCSDIVT